MCELCLQTPCKAGCPNYKPKDTHCYCSECGEMICEGETYYENIHGDMCHAECIINNWSVIDLLYWLDEEMKFMEE